MSNTDKSKEGLSEEFMEAVRTRDANLIWTNAAGEQIDPPPVRPQPRSGLVAAYGEDGRRLTEEELDEANIRGKAWSDKRLAEGAPLLPPDQTPKS